MKYIGYLTLSLVMTVSVVAADDANIERRDRVVKEDCTHQHEQHVDAYRPQHSRRPYDSYDNYNLNNSYGGDSSRYSTSQGWSRGRHYWWGYRGSDIPSAGYSTSTVRKK